MHHHISFVSSVFVPYKNSFFLVKNHRNFYLKAFVLDNLEKHASLCFFFFFFVPQACR